MDTEKPFLIQNRIRNGFLFVFKSCHFLQQILLVIVQLYKIVGFSQKVLAKKKNSIICTTTLTSQVV